jgi:hypothetical protein
MRAQLRTGAAEPISLLPRCQMLAVRRCFLFIAGEAMTQAGCLFFTLSAIFINRCTHCNITCILLASMSLHYQNFDLYSTEPEEYTINSLEHCTFKLRVLQLVKKFPPFYRNRQFITELTITRRWSLSCARSIQSVLFLRSQFFKYICIYS